jgi:hypothetical protein
VAAEGAPFWKRALSECHIESLAESILGLFKRLQIRALPNKEKIFGLERGRKSSFILT